MKNASKHVGALKSLHKKLPPPSEARPTLDPLRAVVLGVLREDAADAAADAAMARFDEEFVDVNELRVATELELADLMGEAYPDVEKRAFRLREVLMALFDGEGRLSLVRVEAMVKKDQRTALRGVTHMTPFVEAHASLLGFGHAAVPLDGRMLALLQAKDVCDAEADVETAQKFLESTLKAEECWPFYSGLRQHMAVSAQEPVRHKPVVKKPAATPKTPA